MKNKMLIFITSLVIFAAAFYLNVASSYASDSDILVLDGHTFSGESFSITGYSDYHFYEYVDGYKYYYYFSSPPSTRSISVVTTGSSNIYWYYVHGGSVGSVMFSSGFLASKNFTSTSLIYPSYNDALNAFLHPQPSITYDPLIAADMEAWTVLDFDANFLTNSILNCGCFFRSNDADHVDIFVSGAKKSDTFTVSGNYGAQWVSLGDYADSGDTVTICYTPYDSDGNWGNTLVISQPVYASVGQGLYQFFTGYTKKVTNSSGTTDIIGIQDPTVITVEDKPTTTPPPVINPIKTTTVYVPVFQGDSGSTVINQYVNNNNVVNNIYNDTYNTINVTTNIEVNFDIDVNTITENVNNIKTDIEDYSGIWVNLLNLFDMFFPFLNGVGAVGVGLFISIIGLILVSIPVRILLHFLS